MVEYELPKLDTGVRFPSPAPILAAIFCLILAGCATAPKHAPVTRTSTAICTPVAEDIYPVAGFAWPVKGCIVSGFGEKVNMVLNKGIDIRSSEGSSVRAAKAGRVVYSDPYMKGFGNTVILDHGNGYQTVYAYNSKILVKVGDLVEQNDLIASVGSTGRAKEPSLHFEIRKDGKPQDPQKYLR